MTEWISVKNRLPPPYKNVLIYSGNMSDLAISIRYLNGRNNLVRLDHIDATVTHWMLLPQPPQPEGE